MSFYRPFKKDFFYLIHEFNYNIDIFFFGILIGICIPKRCNIVQMEKEEKRRRNGYNRV